ncbi:MAG TPA: GGDEF domain-containing protein [Anaeromyxobacter sp.]|nr:GGDEF domain-containing protein [Anaeromyxobacter sp.]
MTVDETRIRPPAPGAAAEGAACLVFVEGAALLGVSVPLELEVVLGRDPGCVLRLPAEDVSRRHARVAPLDGGHLVEDLGSTNGTFVNGETITARRLASGDRIRVGPFVARYLAAGDEAARELEALAALARRDPLTGLANRRAFEEALAREVARAARDEAPLAVIALDVDHFKRVNDAYGHAAGDEVLAEVAARAAHALRAGDLLARVGGEEFAALLPGASLEAAAEAAERVRARIGAAPIVAGEARLAVTVSAGLAALAPGEEGAALLARADGRLYAAKRAGRDRIER